MIVSRLYSLLCRWSATPRQATRLRQSRVRKRLAMRSSMRRRRSSQVLTRRVVDNSLSGVFSPFDHSKSFCCRTTA